MVTNYTDFSNTGPNGEEKYNTCKYRSVERQECLIPTCCGFHRKSMEFVCPKKELYPVSPDKCQNCGDYEKRD